MPHIPTGMAGLFILEIRAEAILDRKGRSLCPDEAPFKAGLILGNAIALPWWCALARWMKLGIG
jgi:hypothetical protein